MNVLGYSRRQVDAINKGRKAGVDISKYANPRFSAEQMEFILVCLIDGIDVTPFADNHFTVEQMTVLAKYSYMEKDRDEMLEADFLNQYDPWELYRSVDDFFEDHFHNTDYNDPEMPARIMEVVADYSFKQYCKEGSIVMPNFSYRKRTEKYKDLANKLCNMFPSIENSRNAALYEVHIWNDNGIDLEEFNDDSIDIRDASTSMQLYEIRMGIESGVDVTIYAKPCFDENQMSMIRIGLERGVDVSRYSKPEIDAFEMENILNQLCNKRTERMNLK